MAGISDALRAKLLDQKKSMDQGGMVIKAKTFRKGRFRLLPVQGDELPGQPYLSFYSKSLKGGTTSPEAFGARCPVNDELDRIFREGSKADKEAAGNLIRRSTEYWIPVIDRENEGTPDNPNVRILPGRKSVYQDIVNWMLDDDFSCDVSHPTEGFDVIIRKEGANLDTVWSIARSPESSPISEDEEMAEAWIDLAARFDVTSKFYPIKLEVLNQMYNALTGDDIPSEYLDDINAVIAGQPVESDEETEEEEAEETEEEEVEEPTASEDADGGWVGKRVTFTCDEGVERFGEVTGIEDEGEDEGHLLVAEDGEDPDEPWCLPPEDCVVEEEEEEPEPAPKPKAKKKAKKTKVAKATKPAATSKTGKKAKARKPGGAAAKIGKKLRG